MKKLILIGIILSLCGCGKKSSVEGFNGFEWGVSDIDVRLGQELSEGQSAPRLDLLYPPDNLYELTFDLAEEDQIILEGGLIERIQYTFRCAAEKIGCELTEGVFYFVDGGYDLYAKLEERIIDSYSFANVEEFKDEEGELKNFSFEDGSEIVIGIDKLTPKGYLNIISYMNYSYEKPKEPKKEIKI